MSNLEPRTDSPGRAIDLNADLGEGCKSDRDLLQRVSSASICCGAHAGDPASIRQTLRSAADCGVVIGAHPGFADRAGVRPARAGGDGRGGPESDPGAGGNAPDIGGRSGFTGSFSQAPRRALQPGSVSRAGRARRPAGGRAPRYSLAGPAGHAPGAAGQGTGRSLLPRRLSRPPLSCPETHWFLAPSQVRSFTTRARSSSRSSGWSRRDGWQLSAFMAMSQRRWRMRISSGGSWTATESRSGAS